MKFSRVAVAVAVGAALAAGCGGGDGGAPGASSQPQSVNVKGVAATGAPLAGATIEVRDATGAVVATTTAASDGSYTLSVPLTAKAPFVVTATRDDVVLYSPMASTSETTVNVTPITTLVAAQLSTTGDPAELASQIESGTATVSTATVQSVVNALTTALAPLMTAVGAGTLDPISGTFAADGSGYDQALNSLNVSINPTGTSSNIAITVKAATVEGSQPPEIAFSSTQTPPTLPDLTTAVLPAPSTDTLIAAFLSKLEQCYVLPVEERVNTQTNAVTASVCREAFYGNDPTLFKHNGVTVGQTGAFSSLWRAGATNLKFTSGSVLFLNAGGNMLVGWRSTAPDGTVNFNRALLRPDGGQLKAYGNQYNYTFNVKPIAESRDLVNTSLSYFATGFNIDVPNVVSGGVPVFEQVKVTTPSGRVITVKPQTGLSYMVAVRSNGTLSGTSIVRLAGKFWTPQGTAQPRQLTSENLFWGLNPAGSNTDWTDAEIAAMPNVGRWKADFYLAGNTTAPDFTQYTVATSRPLTTAEVSRRAFATVSSSVRTSIIGESSANGYIALADGDSVDVSADGGLPGWTVPSGAAAPTVVQVQGFVANSGTPAPRWNDSISVTPATRSVIVPCTPQGESDGHCSTSGSTGTYSANARLNLLQFIGNDGNEVQWMSSIGLFKPALP